MRFLSDSLLEGRAPGTRGYDVAAKYVAAQLEALSLTPAGERGTWFQTVPMRKSINSGQHSSFTLSANGTEMALKDTKDYIFVADLSRTNSDIEAAVVFVGYGVTAPELNYDDYADVDVRGKIIAYLRNAPPRFSPSMRGFYSDGTLLEIARAYTGLRPAPRRSILFLFVTGEEIGTDMEGSGYFAHYPTILKESIVADINIDVAPGMVLFKGSKLAAIGAEHSSLSKNAERAAQRTGYELIPDVRPEENFFVRSDQYSFVVRGMPAVRVGNGGYIADEVKPLFKGHYHTPLDNMDQPLDYAAGARAAGMIFLLGYDVAQQDQRPKWNDNDFFGKRFSPAQ
jgi:Peptidase family M28